MRVGSVVWVLALPWAVQAAEPPDGSVASVQVPVEIVPWASVEVAQQRARSDRLALSDRPTGLLSEAEQAWEDAVQAEQEERRRLAAAQDAAAVSFFVDGDLHAPMRPMWLDNPVGGMPEMPALVPVKAAPPRWMRAIVGWKDDTPPVIGVLDAGGDVPEPTITARTVPEAGPRPQPLSPHEIIVWGTRLEDAKEAVDRKMQDMGYRGRKQPDGRTLYRAEGADNQWKPRVLVDDDGWFRVWAPTASYGGMSLTDSSIAAPAMGVDAPAFTAVPSTPTVNANVRIATKAQRQAAVARVVRQVAPLIKEIERARAAGWLGERLEQLPDELDQIWYEGFAPGGAYLDGVKARQAVLLEIWATRTETPEGETVRQAVGDYILNEVAPATGLDPGLVAQAEQRCGCALGDRGASGDAEP